MTEDADVYLRSKTIDVCRAAGDEEGLNVLEPVLLRHQAASSHRRSP